MAENINKVKTYDGEIHDLEVDLTNYYDKGETDALLNGKVDNSALGAYYTSSQVDEKLSHKADNDDIYTKQQIDSFFNGKADKDDTYTKGEVNHLLDGKSDVGDSYTKSEDDALLSTKADAISVYTKTEADVLLSAKADASDVYTKTEADTLLGTKADASDVYTKTEVDSALGLKANVVDVYSKTETDNLLSAKADTSALADYVTVGAAESTYATKSTVANLTATVSALSGTVDAHWQNTAKLDTANEFSGGNTLKDHYTTIKMSNLDITDDTITPIDGNAGIPIVDKNGVPLAYVNIWQRTENGVTRCDLAIGTEFRTTNPNGRVLVNGREVAPIQEQFTIAGANLWGSGQGASVTVPETGWYQVGVSSGYVSTNPDVSSGIPKSCLVYAAGGVADYHNYFLKKGMVLYCSSGAGHDLYKLSTS